MKRERRAKRKREAEELGDKAPPKQKPKTLDNMREADETFVLPADDEVKEDQAQDEFSDHYAGKVTPKVLITTSLKASKRVSVPFLKELRKTIPNSQFYARRHYRLKTIVGYAKKRGFTHMIVVNEDNKILNGLLVVYLPKGPTALFKLTSVRLSHQIEGHGKMSHHTPELILNNFNTRLGHTVGRLLGSIFPHSPNFQGRRVITLHNQRDFIFFRQHRYIFDDAETARIQELGPQFTLKLRSLQHGTFDTKFGEYEFVHKSENRPHARRKFVL